MPAPQVIHAYVKSKRHVKGQPGIQEHYLFSLQEPDKQYASSFVCLGLAQAEKADKCQNWRMSVTIEKKDGEDGYTRYIDTFDKQIFGEEAQYPATNPRAGGDHHPAPAGAPRAGDEAKATKPQPAPPTTSPASHSAPQPTSTAPVPHQGNGHESRPVPEKARAPVAVQERLVPAEAPEGPIPSLLQIDPEQVASEERRKALEIAAESYFDWRGPAGPETESPITFQEVSKQIIQAADLFYRWIHSCEKPNGEAQG